MQIERVPGRGRINSLGFPIGCTGLDQTLAVCTAELSWRGCVLCRRTGSFPLPAWWHGECELPEITGPSVRALRMSTPSMPWAVAVFASEKFLDGQWPIVGVADAAKAIEFALARASQIKPNVAIVNRGDGHWDARGLRILCREAFVATGH